MGYLRQIFFAFVVLPFFSILLWKGYYTINYWEPSAIDITFTQGKTAVITGASEGGVGFEVAVELALVGVNVDVISRSQSVGEKTVAALKKATLQRQSAAKGAESITKGFFDFHVADLAASPVTSVRSAVASIKAKYEHIDLLILNAGVFSLSPFRVSDDKSFESQIAVSYVSHYVLTAGLLPLLLNEKSKNPRVVATETLGTWFGNLENFTFLPSQEEYSSSNLTKVKVHCNTKLALQSFLEQLRNRYPKIHVVHSHPGMCRSRLFRDFPDIEHDALHNFAQSTWTGALSILRAAVDQNARQSDFVAPNWAMLGNPVLGHLLPMQWPKDYATSRVHRDLFEMTREATGTVWP
jgi:NAD(P)-dependent dehydrogenase (short-subunit alcohol dehydrogenase family)